MATLHSTHNHRSTQVVEKSGSSGRTRTSNPPVNSRAQSDRSDAYRVIWSNRHRPIGAIPLASQSYHFTPFRREGGHKSGHSFRRPFFELLCFIPAKLVHRTRSHNPLEAHRAFLEEFP